MGCLESPRYRRSAAPRNERRCPQDRERPLFCGRGEGVSGKTDGNEGRQNTLVIGLGPNPVHTRSSGDNRKETSTQQHALRREREREVVRREH
jgi:hypothetical protein